MLGVGRNATSQQLGMVCANAGIHAIGKPILHESVRDGCQWADTHYWSPSSAGGQGRDVLEAAHGHTLGPVTE